MTLSVPIHKGRYHTALIHLLCFEQSSLTTNFVTLKKVSTRIHPKNVHENSPFLSTKINPLCPREVCHPYRVRLFCWTFYKWNRSASAYSDVFGRALFLDFLTLFNVLRVFGQYTSLSRQKKERSPLFLAYKCDNFGLVLPIKTCEIWFKMYEICINIAMEELWKIKPF